ncbi:MAG: hypothetical protein EOO28_17740 [Comamonadaceae bacterium]|nr:MAG: hypothetical protein EOO28_17740 [Comamonadaceae bacterium]
MKAARARLLHRVRCVFAALGCAVAAVAGMNAHAAPRLDLTGYADAAGAITVLHGGESADPYFAMQALLLAHDNGFDIAAPAEKFVDWLLPKQKPDGTFDRFCRLDNGDWLACKTADADDSLLAMWMRLLETMPEKTSSQPAWSGSYRIAQRSLAHLFQPSRGVYMVSPVYLHGLFMDNLEVWALKRHSRHALPGEADALAQAIRSTFGKPDATGFLVSTQLEQRWQPPVFYPDHVAQIFPLTLDFPMPAAKSHYAAWMAMHRGEWLRHSQHDYPWGIIAVAALRQGDVQTVSCWLREAAGRRHSARWAVTDEVSMQLITASGARPAPPQAACT